MHECTGFSQQDSLHPPCTDTAQIAMSCHSDDPTAAPVQAMPCHHHCAPTSLSIWNVCQQPEKGHTLSTSVLAPPPSAATASAAATTMQLHHVSSSVTDGGLSDEDSILAEIDHRICLSAAIGFAHSDDSDGCENESDCEDLVPPC